MRTRISGEEARLDISVRGFWGSRFEQALFDVRVFNPSAPTNRSADDIRLPQAQAGKAQSFEQWFREVERDSFTALVFAASGGMGKAATVFHKLLAGLLA